ncbi:nucleoporin Nup85-like protein [Chlamydoabsidia padenii]|nr:nucleoporin Nup85-like protein [Chlamydoabsidia padenii]
MSSSSVPPSNDNPVGSFDTSDSTITSTVPTSPVNDESINEDTKDTTSLSVDDQISNEDLTDNEAGQEEDSPTVLANTLLTKINGRRDTTEKEFHQLLMEPFQKLQDWRSQQSNLISTSDMTLTDWQKSQVDDYISDYVSLIRSNFNPDLGLGDNDALSDTDQMTPSMVWTLFQALFESSVTGKKESIIGELANWLNDYFALDSIGYKDSDATTELDWDLIKKLVLRGETKAAASLLEGLNDEGNDYSTLIQLLSDIPATPTSISVSYRKTTWATEWESWHYQVESAWDRYRQKGSLEEEDGHLLVWKILMGDKKVIRQNGTFADRCLATLLYTNPSAHAYDTTAIANQVYDSSRDGDFISISIYSLFTGDYDALLGSLGDKLWMQVHFGNLLLAIGYIPSDDDDQQSATITEEKITEPIYYCLNLYATEIAHKYDMWTEAMQYIMVCRSNTNIWIKKLLGEPPLASKDLGFLKEILKFCTLHKLVAIKAILYSAIGKRYESNGDFVDAATNYADANDMNSLDIMARNHLNFCLEKGTLQPVVTDPHYIKMTNRSPSYSFYQQYCELKANIEGTKHDEAYQTAMKLLQSLEDATEKYRVVLLVDIFDILKKHRRISEQDTTIMLQQLDLAINDLDQKAFFPVYYKRCHSDSSVSAGTIVARLKERLGFSIISNKLSL